MLQLENAQHSNIEPAQPKYKLKKKEEEPGFLGSELVPAGWGEPQGWFSVIGFLRSSNADTPARTWSAGATNCGAIPRGHSILLPLLPSHPEGSEATEKLWFWKLLKHKSEERQVGPEVPSFPFMGFHPKNIWAGISRKLCSVTKSWMTFYDPMDCSTPGLPVPHHLLESAQVHVHWISDATQPSHPLSPSSPSAFNLCQHQGLFQWVSCLHQVAKVLELQFHHQSFQWVFRVDFL